jgi:hypothetical protein
MRLVMGRVGPQVPYVLTRDAVDRGLAGSLVQVRSAAVPVARHARSLSTSYNRPVRPRRRVLRSDVMPQL